MKALDDLVGLLSRLPGIGKKSASRLAFHLLGADEYFLVHLAESIGTIKSKVKFCSECGGYTENDPCDICSSGSRDRLTICVVEQPQDIISIENSREYSGLYHSLGGLISPLDGVGPDSLRIGKLLSRIRTGGMKEVILATNPNVEGDTTALYVQKMLEPLGVFVSRLATGIPVGGDLEYADRITLARSLRGRVRM